MSALLWLTAVSTGFASSLATWVFIDNCTRRITVKRRVRVLSGSHAAARPNLPIREWIQYVAPVVGFLFALKIAWDGGWILTLCIGVAGMMLMTPIRIWANARNMYDITPVVDLALVCMECHTRDKGVLHTLDEVSAALDHPKLRETVQDALEYFYNGATEGEALQLLVSQNRNRNWALLIWTLLEQQRSDDGVNLRGKLTALMRQRHYLHKRALPALEFTRHSVELAVILCAAWTTYLTISPASTFYLGSSQGQLLGSIALLALVWTTLVWSAQVQTIQRIIE